jgi:hypothetical protein
MDAPVTCMAQKYKQQFRRKHEGNRQLEVIGVEEMIILKHILKK